MMTLSDKTQIVGYDGKISTLNQTLADRNLHRATQYDVFGAHVQTGTVKVKLRGEWHKVRFDCKDGWVRTLEVVD